MVVPRFMLSAICETVFPEDKSRMTSNSRSERSLMRRLFFPPMKQVDKLLTEGGAHIISPPSTFLMAVTSSSGALALVRYAFAPALNMRTAY